jgi:hypothetical protein
MDVRSGFQPSWHNIIWHYVVWASLSKPQNKHSKQPVKPIWNDSSTVTKVKMLQKILFSFQFPVFFFQIAYPKIISDCQFKINAD